MDKKEILKNIKGYAHLIFLGFVIILALILFNK
jgi:hypothetical protein